MYDKDMYDSIWRRTSVRKYLDKRIEDKKIAIIEKSISELNGESGLTMEFAENFDSFKTVLTLGFKNVRSVIVVKGKTNDPNLKEKCGYYGERMILEATYHGLGTCWVAGYNKKSGSLNAKEDETVVCVVSIGYGEEGMGISTKVPAAPHRKTRSISDFLGGNKDVPEWVESAMKAVQFAPTAMNSQKARFIYSDGKLSVRIPEGNLTMVDLGITKLHFELAAGGKFAMGTPAEFEKDQ